MYEAYWQLSRKPFDQAFHAPAYYPTEAHQGALLKLRYAVESRSSAALLAGRSGVGKTLLVHLLRRQLAPPLGPMVHMVFPKLAPAEFLAALADELGAPAAPGETGREHGLRRIRNCVLERAAKGQHTVIVVDEAHLLDLPDALETLRLLLNLEFDGRPALTMLLVGQPALLPALDRMSDFDERLNVKCLLRPLTLEETVSYVAHQLQAAGRTTPIFDAAALEAIYLLSDGVPRRINRLGDLALLIGFAENRETINAEQIDAVAQELVAVGPE